MLGNPIISSQVATFSVQEAAKYPESCNSPEPMIVGRGRAQGAPETLFRRRDDCWPVSTRVGNIGNNDPSLIELITA
jgi:hypothetical protein